MSMTNEQLVEEIKAGKNVQENMLQLWKQNKGFICKIIRKHLNNAEFEAAKSSLLTAFETVFSTIMTSDVYTGKNLKWIILEGTLVKYEIRYATILNGKMLYFCIENTNGPLTDAQKQEVNQIIDTLQY